MFQRPFSVHVRLSPIDCTVTGPLVDAGIVPPTDFPRQYPEHAALTNLPSWCTSSREGAPAPAVAAGQVRSIAFTEKRYPRRWSVLTAARVKKKKLVRPVLHLPAELRVRGPRGYPPVGRA